MMALYILLLSCLYIDAFKLHGRNPGQNCKSYLLLYNGGIEYV